MVKYGKELTLSIAPYKTVKLLVTEADSFEECNIELLKELNRMPEVKELNEAEIKKVLGNGKKQ